VDAVTTPAPDPFRLDLGAYLTGSLEPDEAAALERHLAGCDGCRAELARLAVVLPALARLPPDQVDGRFDPPRARPENALAALRAARRRSLRRRIVAGAAGTAVAAALVGAVVIGERDDGTRVVAAGDRATDVWAQVRMTDDAGGTELALRLNGVPPKIVCALVAVARDGRRQTAATWTANYEGEAEVRGQVGISAADLSSLQVVRDDGRPLITLPIDG
jgi:hypothetical protein